MDTNGTGNDGRVGGGMSRGMIAVLAAAALVAIGGAYVLIFGGSLITIKEPVQLTIWHVYGNQTVSPMNDLIDEFNRTVGRENGVSVHTSVLTDGDVIDDVVTASLHDDPGSQPLPDLLTIYPSMAATIGAGRLIDWRTVIDPEHMGSFVEPIVEEGMIGGSLCVLPIAKSTEILFVNETLFERFGMSDDARASMQSFDDLFEMSVQYAEEHDGRAMFMLDSYYTYFLTQVASLGGELIRSSRIDASSPEFERAFTPLALAAIRGGVSLEDGYAAARWNTGEILCNISSSASILYFPREMAFGDDAPVEIACGAMALPAFTGVRPAMVSRGAGLAAFKSGDPERDRAAALFATWLTQPEVNIRLATSGGYMPVTKSAFASLLDDLSLVADPRCLPVYQAIKQMYGMCPFVSIPLYNGSGADQRSFERSMRDALRSARDKYLRLLEADAPADAAAEELAREALAKVVSSIRK